MVQLKFGCDQSAKTEVHIRLHGAGTISNSPQRRDKNIQRAEARCIVCVCVCLFWCNFEILNVTDARACPSLHFPTINAHELFKHFSFSEKGVFRIFPKKK